MPMRLSPAALPRSDGRPTTSEGLGAPALENAPWKVQLRKWNSESATPRKHFSKRAAYSRCLLSNAQCFLMSIFECLIFFDICFTVVNTFWHLFTMLTAFWHLFIVLCPILLAICFTWVFFQRGVLFLVSVSDWFTLFEEYFWIAYSFWWVVHSVLLFLRSVVECFRIHKGLFRVFHNSQMTFSNVSQFIKDFLECFRVHKWLFRVGKSTFSSVSECAKNFLEYFRVPRGSYGNRSMLRAEEKYRKHWRPGKSVWTCLIDRI